MNVPKTLNPIHRFSRGFKTPFAAFHFLRQYTSLIKYVWIPFVINLIIFGSAVYFGLALFENYVVQLIPHGNAWYWFLINYLIWIIAILVTAVVVFFSFAVIGSLIASPFNDILSEQTERIITKELREERFRFALFFQDARRSFVSEGKKILIFIVSMVLLLLLNFIPVVGALLYPICSTGLILFFLVVEYTGYVFSRRRLTFKEQRHYIFSNKSTLLGFGTGLLLIVAIPFLQFLCIPLGVIGGTILCLDSKSLMPEKVG